MNQRTTTQSHQPDANETLSELTWRNRHARYVTTNPAIERTIEPVITRRRRFHMSKAGWSIFAGMLLVLALWIAVQQFIIPAYGWSQDQWHYGDSRITQMDANVGHGGESHFLAEYYQGNIVVIEIPLAHPKDAHGYTLTSMIGATATPIISLSVQDINHDGKPDLIVRVEGTAFQTILFNTGTAFSESEG